jgi:hypothetical protein
MEIQRMMITRGPTAVTAVALEEDIHAALVAPVAEVKVAEATAVAEAEAEATAVVAEATAVVAEATVVVVAVHVLVAVAAASDKMSAGDPYPRAIANIIPLII